jgi:hypothetical protein
MLAAVLAALFAPVLGQPAWHTAGFVQDVRPDSAVVCKYTAEDRSLELVVADGDTKVATVASSGSGRHEFRVTGLAAGREYAWHVREAGSTEALETGSLRTPPADDRAPVRFALVGDAGGQPWWNGMERSLLVHALVRARLLPPKSEVAAIGAAMAAAAPEFWVHAGDVIYPDPLTGSWIAGFFMPFESLARRSPCYVAIGNHDLMGDNGTRVLETFTLPTRAGTADERMYSFAWGPVRVVVMDTNFTFDAATPSLAYLKAALSDATEPWVVVVGHHPILSASRHRDRADLIEHLLPVLERAGVDLYVSGHDHTYQRLRTPGGMRLVVTGGGGKSLYDLRPHPAIEVMHSTYHWCRVDVLGPTLTLRAFDLHGTAIDELVLQKGDGDAQLTSIRSFQPRRAERIEALLR